MHRIPVRQIMRTPVYTIHPEAHVADAAQLLQDHNLRRLPVVDEHNHVVGIVTDSDIREAETAGRVLNSYEPGVEERWLAIADMMTCEVVTIEPDATVGQLAIILMQHKVGGVPVVEADPHHPQHRLLVGIVTETDIFRMIADAWRAELAAREGAPNSSAATS
jgi:CBS domain-containing protein